MSSSSTRAIPKTASFRAFHRTGLVIFGITGDLARKKLSARIYDLASRGLLHPFSRPATHGD